MADRKRVVAAINAAVDDLDASVVLVEREIDAAVREAYASVKDLIADAPMNYTGDQIVNAVFEHCIERMNKR